MLLNSGKRKSCNDYNVKNLANGKLLYTLYKLSFLNKILPCDIFIHTIILKACCSLTIGTKFAF